MAAVYGVGSYFLLQKMRGPSALFSYAFLVVQPAAICAFIAYMLDLRGNARLARYMFVPLWTLLGVIAISALFLKEGLICILMLAPLWMISGIVGTAVAYHMRDRAPRGTVFCSALLALPLLVAQVEPLLPASSGDYVVSRSAVIAAPPGHLWPLLRGIPDVRPGEGRWNVSQDIVGLSRPLSAQLVGDGIGAARLARWSEHIEFKERIVEWRENERIGWQFDFAGSRGWEFTDPHLRPDSSYFKVTTGGYSLTPLDAGHTLVTLQTRYWIATPVNGYASLWGELFLGDLENNLLALVKGRAER